MAGNLVLGRGSLALRWLQRAFQLSATCCSCAKEQAAVRAKQRALALEESAPPAACSSFRRSQPLSAWRLSLAAMQARSAKPPPAHARALGLLELSIAAGWAGALLSTGQK